MKRSIKEAIYKENGVIITRLNLNESGGLYQLEITKYDEEGYYNPAGSFTLWERSARDEAIEYFDELIEANKQLELTINNF